MGLFDTEYIYHSSTSVQRVVDDTGVPDFFREAMVNSLFDHETNVSLQRSIMSESVDFTLQNGPVQKFEAAYRYAASGRYYYGLPDSHTTTRNQGTPDLRAVLETIEGGPVVINYSRFSRLDHVHVARQQLADNYNWDFVSNEVPVKSAEKGFTVYVEDVVPSYHANTEEFEAAYAGTLDAFSGLSFASAPTPFRSGGSWFGRILSQQFNVKAGSNEVNGAEVTYVWADANGDKQTETEFFDFGTYSETKEYFHAEYVINDVVKYFTYLPGGGDYPSLDAVYAVPPITSGSYFPFLVYRKNYSNRAGIDQESEEFLTTVKLASYLGQDYVQMSETIHSNPGIGDVINAVCVMAVPMNTDDPREIEYLFRYFKQLHSETSGIPIDFDPNAYTETGGGPSGASAVTGAFGGGGIGAIAAASAASGGHISTQGKIATSIRDGGFQMDLRVGWLKHTVKIGNVAPLKDYTIERKSRLANSSRWSTTYYYWVIRYQVSEQVYEELEVGNPMISYPMPEGEIVQARGGDPQLLIPVDMFIAKQMSYQDREALYHRGLHFIFNALVEQEVKWYEQEWFTFLLIIIAVIIIVYSGFTLTGPISSLIAAITAGQYIAAVIIAVKMLAFSIFMRELTELAIKELGLQAAIILIIVAMIVGGSFDMMDFPMGSEVWAENLLKVSMNMVSVAADVMADMMDDVQMEMMGLQEEVDTAQKEADRALGLLEMEDTGLNPWIFVGDKPLTVWGESPDDLYNRTIHQGNPGVMGFEIIENYFETSLKLPSINKTIDNLPENV